MRIAFYAPLKSPGHAVPSGDRLMARQLVAALELGGHQVTLASELRSFARAPDLAALAPLAATEMGRLAALWQQDGAPDLWFSYHPYYKSPDLIGPPLARQFGLAYVTAESSWSPRVAGGPWDGLQQVVRDGIRQAAVNICFTARDRDGLLQGAPEARVAMLPPFLEAGAFTAPAAPDAAGLMTVAMMRPGDKMKSYATLAEVLALLPDTLPWHLTVVGDGPCRAAVMAAFATIPPARLRWVGQQTQAQLAALLAAHQIYVWPGWGEAYGLAYLEAQAAGLPVVAQAVAGVPSVVDHGRTGLLTAPGDVAAQAEAVLQMLTDHPLRHRMAAAARQFGQHDRAIAPAAARLNAILAGAA